MTSDAQIKQDGYRALATALGDVEAERFIILVRREPFDYTMWQRKLWAEMSVESISHAAAQSSRAAQPSE